MNRENKSAVSDQDIKDSTERAEVENSGYHDPKQFLEDFDNHINFNQIVEDKIKRLRENGAEIDLKEDLQDIQIVMRRTDKYKNALWDWSREHKLIFDTTFLSNDFTTCLYGYWNIIRHHRKEREEMHLDKDDIINMDYERTFAHMRAAKQLVIDRITDNETIGRIIVQLYTIAVGLDYEDRNRDQKRINAI